MIALVPLRFPRLVPRGPFRLLVAVLSATFSGLAAHAEPCRSVSPSGTLPFHEARVVKSGMPVDAGVEAVGFIQPPELATVAGIGVSKYQADVDFARAKDCGAQFVIVRLSAGTDAANEPAYKAHWRNAKGSALFVAPYHNLTYASYFPDHDPLMRQVPASERARAVDQASTAASTSRVQSGLFLDHLDQLLASDPVEAVGTWRGKLFLDPILDLTYDPWTSADAAIRESVAPVVQQAACTFVEQVKSDPRFGVKRVIVFTTPQVWRAYRLGDAHCDLGAGGVALSLMTRDGGAIVTQPEFADICGTPRARRCVLEHYTSYSTFLNFGASRASELLRVYGGEEALRERLNALP